ncbi:MAG TPA: hypothetical protein VJA21_17500, partial [Verrucomicrobiae bacterium]
MKKVSFLGLVLFSIAGPVFAQATKTWNGSAGSDWFNANNWTPAGVPASTDIVNFSSGTISLTAPVTLSNQFNWSGGTLAGNPMTIAPSGALLLGGTGTKYLQNVLTNAGTVTWTNGAVSVQNDGGGYKGAIENVAGGLWDIRCDQSLSSYWGGTNAYFHNLGTLQKTAADGTTYVSVPIYNGGSVAAQQGALNFQNGSTIEGVFTASAGAGIVFSGGAFRYSTAPTMTGPGAIQFTGGTLTLLTDVIPNLQLNGGTLSLSPGFQGGSITNLTLSGSTLSGSYTVTGTLNWSAGTIGGALSVNSGGTVNWGGGTAGGPVTVASGGGLVLGGSGTKYLRNVLTNAGTITWTNGSVSVQNDGGGYKGAIENLAGGLWDIRCDQSLSSYWGGTNAYFHNLGTVQKSAAGGTTYVSVPIYNSGSVVVQQGTLNFQNGAIVEGSYTASADAAISFSGGAFSYSVVPVISGSGAVQLTGGTLTLLDDVIRNLQFNGGTLSLNGGFQGGTITNLILTGSTLSGSYTVTGTLNCGGGVNGSLTVANGAVVNWGGGAIAGALQVNGGGIVNWSGGSAGGPVTVASGASLLVGGTGTKYLANVLTNAGTVTWTNGTIYVQNDGGGYKGAIENLAGGLWDIRCDQSLSSYWGGTNAYFHNLGTMQKTAAGATTYVSLPIYNGGVVAVQQGTLNFQDGGVIEGGFAANAGAAILFSGGAFSYSVVPVVTGPGSIQWTGGSLTLHDDVIPNLQLNGGTLSLGPNFQGGSISNLAFGGTLSGNYTVSGTLSLGNGISGSLTVGSNGVVNWSGGNVTGGVSLTNGSVLNWSGGGLLVGLNVVPGAFVNWSGGSAGEPVTVASGASLLVGGTGTKYLANVLTNAGTVTWTNGTIYVQNDGGG